MPRNRRPDLLLIASTTILITLGLLLVASAGFQLNAASKYHYFAKQAVVALVGLGIMVIVCFIPFRYMEKKIFLTLSWFFFVGFLGVLYFLPPIAGTHRWIHLFSFSFQPSEFARLVHIGFLSYLLRQRQFAQAAVATGILVLTIGWEPDLGSALLVLAVSSGLFFLCQQVPYKWVLGVGIWVVLGLGGFIFFKGYHLERIQALFHPDIAKLSSGYQGYQALIALGSGGIVGKGLGASTQKLVYLPQAHTDFAFAILGEEMGFLGTLLVLFAFLTLGASGYALALRFPSGSIQQFVALGLTFNFLLQAFVHMSVNLVLLPTKGLTLPFISYGGSSFLASCLGVGILLRLSLEAA